MPSSPPSDSSATTSITVPRELLTFFERKGGQTLLIKGGPGTGKTMLALEILRYRGFDKGGVAVFTRLDRDEVVKDFPWLAESAQLGRCTIYDRNDDISDPNKFKIGLLQLSRSREVSIFVVDTLDAIIERYDNPSRKEKILVDTFKSEEIDAALVQETKGETYLDYLVDGIVTLEDEEIGCRKVRRMVINKLRGVAVDHTRYLFTLEGGRFNSLDPFKPAASPVALGPWEPIPDRPGCFSTGIADMDDLLGGGYKRGSYNVIEVADEVEREEYMSLVRPLMLNFLSQGRGGIFVLSGGVHPDTMRDDLTRFVSNDRFESLVRIADYFSTSSDKPYILALGTKDKGAMIKSWSEALAHLRGPDSKPILEFTGFDTLEYIRGSGIALRELLSGIAATKVSSDLGLGLIKPGLHLTQGIRNMADTYFKVLNLDGTTCVYGLKPKTPICAISQDPELGYPHIRLTAMV